MFKKFLRLLTYNGDGDNICGDGVGMGTLVMGMGWGWGCKFIPVSIFILDQFWSQISRLNASVPISSESVMTIALGACFPRNLPNKVRYK